MSEVLEEMKTRVYKCDLTELEYFRPNLNAVRLHGMTAGMCYM